MAEKNPDKIDNETIGFGIFSNIFWGAAFAIASIVALPSPFTPLGQFLKALPFSIYIKVPIFMLLYPVIGKLFCEAIHLICNAIDTVYEFENPNKWGSWTKDKKIMFASWWPLAAPLSLIGTLIALLYGILFKSLFK